ncbi:Phosphodiest-domain-containing protein [Coniochaeta ligniaria NRRL 30616]|uniref:Phosphodiest-domain-containing protein n=1 Tax=Coniochaeta ligniaria NRRL 30616 TaxID=1408157 RepID=A0A1J7JKY6_9PEZI|nr:Phosphodiest-domain-containing protein [Coniochaeta ligniaria NRRL 30616]
MPPPISTADPPLLRSQTSRSLLSPSDPDGDAASIRSDQDTDSDDDERLRRARNSRELRAHDRLVLMEEEELDALVTASRRQERRGSGLVPVLAGPLRLLRSASRSGSRDGVRSPALESSESLVQDEKRRHRRERRRVKKDRILGDAQHGEDGELMYEMEQGGLKEGSETGDSTEREDSEEGDRKGLLYGDGGERQRRKGGWRRWLFIHALIATAFAILVLLAWKLSINRRLASRQDYVSNGTALFAPTTIIISLDGFRADFLNRGLTPRLNAFVREGVSPLYMLPSFPSVTFPNHYTLATGLYPESHGVVGNSFWDPALQEKFYYTDAARSLDPKWWDGEPFWVTAEKQGIRTAIHMWPGSEAHIAGIEPSFLDKYNGKEKLGKKVARIFEFLDKPGVEDPAAQVVDMRPQVIAAYVPNVDSDGHKFGPNSTEIRDTIKRADDMIDAIFSGLEERNLTHIVNVIVVSDHGMATTDVSRLIQLEDLVDLSKIAHTDGWPLIGLRPKNPEDLGDIYGELAWKAKDSDSFDVYLRDVDMPERYHFSRNERIAPLWIVPKTGWAIVKKDEINVEEAKAKSEVYHPRGLHGYDHEHPLMRAIFIARGPAFPHPPGSQLEAFQNTEVYNILCDSVGLTPMPNNGTLRLPLSPIGLHDADGEGSGVETPPDPVDSSTYTSSGAADTPSSSAALAIESSSTIPGPATASSAATSTTAAIPTTSVVELEPAPTDAIGDEDDDDENFSETHSFWDWLTDKISDAWDKITGSDS